jgi:hypothetical protein
MPGPYFDPASDDTADRYLNTASDLIDKWAPEPNPMTADYPDKRERAEGLLYDYLSGTQGASISSVSASVGSLSFTDIDKLKSIVSQTMGSYYVASKLRLRIVGR